MGFMLDMITKGVEGFFGNMANQLLAQAFKMMTHFLLNFSDINEFLDVKKYLTYSQAIAGSFLLATIAWEGFKYQSGGLNSKTNSISELVTKMVYAGAGIFILPWSVTKIFLPMNDLVVKLISEIGVDYKVEFNKITDVFLKLSDQGIVIIFALLVMAIAFFILAIVSAIRYVDLVISILISPFCAVSVINSADGATTWAKETTAIVFTQSIHLLLVQILIRIMTKNQNLIGILLSIGTIVVMVKGANVLKPYMYKSGAGAGTMSIGSMAIMKSNFKIGK
ncbi:MAG: hypothetical protein MJH09_02100 [Cetobacterium sp.]|nr:hypothetical protein [Cetobacterium sp.]